MSDDEETRDVPRGRNKRARISVVPVNGVGVGKVVRVRLVNFMCHSNLVFTFGDKVNFISGRNGSGKSAILTALVVGLGGRMSDTNRGTSIAKLLKNGEQRGSIEITLSNHGALAYEEEKYGREITIVRTFTDSSSTYKTLSEKGEVVSTKKSEIQLILMSFNIQVSNPVAILNQDTARTFLSRMQPKELYTLFRKGTLLDEIENRLEELANFKLPRLQALVRQKKNAANESAQDLVRYVEAHKKRKKLCEHQNECARTERLLSWAYVAKLEQKMAETEAQKLRVEANIDQLRESMESREGAETTLKTKLAADEQQLNEVVSQIEEVEQGNVAFEQEMNKWKTQLTNKVHDVKKLQKKIHSETERCKQLQSEIDNSQCRSAEVEAKRAEILKQRAELRKRLEELIAVVSTTETHKQQVSDTVDNIRKNYEQSERFANNTLMSINHKKAYLNGLEKAKDELHVFSEWMPSLVAAIERAHSQRAFDKKPLGPFGRYIKLIDESWGPAVERYLGDFVFSFAVSCARDAAVMKKIFDRCSIPTTSRPPVIVTSFENKVYDISRTEVSHPRYLNLFRSVQISDPVVANILIDLIQPDTVLLVPTSRETYPLADDARNVPLNCKTFINKDGTRVYPAPLYRIFSLRVSERSRYLQVSPEQVIRITKAEIERLQQDYRNAKKESETRGLQLRDEQSKFDQLKKELYQLQRKKSACEIKLEEFEQMELPETNDDGILAADLAYRMDLLDTAKGELEERIREKDEIAEKLKGMDGSAQEKNAQREELQKKVLEIKKVIEKVKQDLRKYNTNHNHFKEGLKVEMMRKVRIDEKIDQLRKSLDEALRTANGLSPEREQSDESMEQLEKKMTDLRYTIRALEREVAADRPPEIEDFAAREEKHKQTMKGLVSVTKAFQAMLEEQQQLKVHLRNMTRIVGQSTQEIFKDILARRSFVGDIKIDEEKKELALIVKADPTVKAKTVISTLSGGERSYSMVAFLLSIWRSMSIPFYILDEFDVYMDEVNRQLVMELLMFHARQSSANQFVFLTPHATSDESANDVHFFRLVVFLGHI
ncbi:Structural maintenance of [Nesidiocoris tenuis]|uniref:Structural maintenance of n=1 Tax=Nesidiocoris tenuis TaxID=355587 RepID=A0ABN7AWX4_9HEMI|nr:Structural maintenance of [Nesidiocoris tenuis]